MKKLVLFFLSVLFLLTLTACHGRKQLSAFEVPDGLDETKHYEITFWAKNDTNVALSRSFIRTSR